jgi:hypothetical protein
VRGNAAAAAISHVFRHLRNPCASFCPRPGVP